jgi:hypothetical protein
MAGLVRNSPRRSRSLAGGIQTSGSVPTRNNGNRIWKRCVLSVSVTRRAEVRGNLIEICRALRSSGSEAYPRYLR